MAACPECGALLAYDGTKCAACGARNTSADAASTIRRARRLMAEKRYAGVVTLLSPESGWIKEHASNADAWRILAAAHARMSDWRSAAEAAAQVVELARDDPHSWSRWGIALRKTGRLREAEKAQRRALSIDANHRLASAELRKMEVAQEAEAVLKRARQYPPPTKPHPIVPAATPSTVEQPPAESTSTEHEVIYSAHGSMITDSLVQIAGGKVYAVANLTSVDIREQHRPADMTGPILTLLFGILIASAGLLMTAACASPGAIDALIITVPVLLFGCAVTAAAVKWLKDVKPPPSTYYLFLTSAAGEVEACRSHDRRPIEQLATAIMTAISRARH